MADDDDSKTEDASSHKLDEARLRGQVAQSREVTNLFAMSGGAGALLIFGPHISTAMQQSMQMFFQRAGTMRIDGTAVAVMLSTMNDIAMALLPAFALMIAAGLAGTVLQSGIIFATDKLVPKLEHISIGAGIKRLFSVRALVEFLKGLLKMTAVGSVAFTLLMPEIDRLPMLTSFGAAAMAHEIMMLAIRLVGGVLAALALIAVADYAYQKISFMNSMRMSKQEVKEEYKQQEGDPFMKGKLRQIRTERARRRMMSAVPNASVIVTNPTHFAVALQYEMNSAGAPRLVAKGADLVAARIREVARAHDIPIVENPPVARALYATVEIDQEVPPEHYKAVAEIISYVFRLKGKSKQR
ncbi:MAG: flagellar biosynthesis protein FlhB [Rhodospirillales bacterium]|nr:flagellar biosynthesis protein FlhB [Rhodospirillales bacterium]